MIGTLFFDAVFARRHKRLASIIYVSMSTIWRGTLSKLGRGLHAMALMAHWIGFDKWELLVGSYSSLLAYLRFHDESRTPFETVL
jgi:hypothetical protein